MVAIVLTIMVLEIKIPAEPTLAAALEALPLLGAYLLAFVNVAIYWNNHHHMMQSTRTSYRRRAVGQSCPAVLADPVPADDPLDRRGRGDALAGASFGIVLIGASAAYVILERALIRAEGEESNVKLRSAGARRSG